MHGIFFNEPIEKNYVGHQLSEIYRDGVYVPFLQGKKDLTIVDIGANIGSTAYYFSQFAKIVHAVEPSKEHFDVLNHMIKYNKLKNVKTHNMAIWIKNMEGDLFHNSQNNTMFSLHGAVNDTNLAEKVKVVTLDKFFKDNKIEHCDFMKIDIEGSEYELLGGPGFRKVAPKINTVFLEYHEWAGRNPAQLEQSLKNNGFQISRPQSTATLLVGTK